LKEDLASSYYNLGYLKKDISLLDKAKKLAPEKVMFQETYRENKPMLAPISYEERNEAVIGAENWRSSRLLIPWFIKLLTGRGYSFRDLFAISLSPEKGLESTQQIREHHFPSLYALIALGFLISLFFTPRKSDGFIEPGRKKYHRILQIFIPGSKQIVRGNTLLGILLFYLTLWSICAQLIFRAYGFPGILTTIAMPHYKRLIDFQVPVIPTIIRLDPVWWSLCYGSLFVLIGIYLFNFIYVSKSTPRRQIIGNKNLNLN